MSALPPAFRLHARVASALASGRALVALETAVLTHGLPRPLNLEVARGMEQAVRDAGAEPATIAVLDGRLRVGLDEAELQRLAEAEDAMKCARRELPVALASGRPGGTTVSATAFVARAAGIQIFATGGIGGVHRGAPFDVSADLAELGRRRISVICSGAKSLLDLPATLEVLESQGVAVVGYGCDTLPAFYTADSGLAVGARVDDPTSAAELVRARDALGLESALLFCQPVPSAQAMPREEIEALVDAATREAALRGLRGPAVTPHVLSELARRSGGRTLVANEALLLSNARLAGEIAVALAAR